MAKNSKRQISFTTPSAASANRPSGSAVRPGSEFNPDYTYVKNDLKNMGIQVLFFMGVLIVLSLILR